ncbi:major facilitator superfamily domain-containing protein [Rhizophagus irregularis DAOM 181602=DAOM 197198]|nr:major facilitator superfamily domain-containing protein [Rhizophagus irregularis DAOM 181602=DAOM 197198]POG78809.1 major facilitator superfamily domain-containing protein [Rhizophagus irregularis DAOM 181602=DAOM 197198]|eukprot:XP_025185675.1 major facilitator superfamily domain-containing protein [Rhizophagus irregularis DAOM 181602=DAOM 197198]
MKETPRSSTTSVDISARGIAGQEDIDSNFNVNNNSDHGIRSNNKEINIPSIRGGNKTVKMILLTQCLAGLQFTWTVELAYGTPYLLSIGLSKSIMSLVWLAGPLSGLIMQPIVGTLSDNSTSRFGRRRPFLLAGSLAVVCAFMFIGWSKEIIGIFFSKESSMMTLLTQCLAVVSFYVLDFAINCVQASCRVLIVDILPPSQQEEGTAWAGRMVGIGSVLGYFMGFVNLVEVFPFLGKTQLQVLCVIASILLLVSDALTCWAVTEQIYTGSSNKSTSALTAAYETLASIIKSIRTLPKYIQQICNVQLFAWIGWFPFLFYSTTWVAEIHSRFANDSSEEPSDDSVGDSIRAGSFSLLLYSIISLVASFVLPFLISSNDSTRPKFSWRQLFQIPFVFLTVPKLWTISHFIFASSMLSTWFVTNGTQANILISLCGIAWAITMWAPFSILGEYIAKEYRSPKQSNDIDDDTNQLMYNLVETGAVLEGGDNESEDNDENLRTSMRTSTEETTSEIPFIDSHGDISTKDSSEAGVLLGIHNIYIVLPQFLVTIFSSIIFAILEPSGDKNTIRQHHPHDKNLDADSIGFVLRVGGFMAIIAGFLSIKLWK